MIRCRRLPGTHASLTYAIDPRRAPAVDKIPQWVLHWLVSHAVGSIFDALAACARRARPAPLRIPCRHALACLATYPRPFGSCRYTYPLTYLSLTIATYTSPS